MTIPPKPSGAPIFRQSQSFFVLRADQLLEKLRWDLTQLEQLRWEESLGDTWRQVVSYKAIDCAMSIWHLPEWFAEDVWALNPVNSLCAFLDITNHDPFAPLPFKVLRDAAVAKCPDLDICRIISNASKHSKVNHQPKPGLTTFCYWSTARRSDEPSPRPVMWIAVEDAGIKRDMREVFHACFVFWSHLAFVSRPGTTWKKGDPLPEVMVPSWTGADAVTPLRPRSSLAQLFTRWRR